MSGGRECGFQRRDANDFRAWGDGKRTVFDGGDQGAGSSGVATGIILSSGGRQATTLETLYAGLNWR